MYHSLEECVLDLERSGQLIRVHEEVDPYLEMAAIHLKVNQAGGPALLFENVKGSKYRAVSNLFGNLERSKFIFRNTLEATKEVITLRNDPMSILKNPFKHISTGLAASKALPIKKAANNLKEFKEIQISDLPLIHHWPKDGGAFVTLPQVYTENPEKPPAHSLAAIMPLPEGLSEMTFAGLLSGRNFRYCYVDDYCISLDADFVITGEIYPGETKPEGPFGDHIGYYSLVHDFPLMRVHKVYAKKNGIWPFTVVGRPPQEDTAFGELIHELTGNAVKQEIPGVKEVHAVDAAGVHPLLFAIGSERYTPYQNVKQPAEILTLANRILGTGQLSLAKYLFITAEDNQRLDTHKEIEFLTYILERIDLHRDIHFQTNTTIDTLDYSGTGLNTGSKVVIAAYGDKKRELCKEVLEQLKSISNFGNPRLVMPGIIAIEGPEFSNYQQAQKQIDELCSVIKTRGLMPSCPMIILCDDSSFISGSLQNFLWSAFTRSNPSHDIHGVNSFYDNKHWGCDNLIIDIRTKPHHAPNLIPDPTVAKNIDRLFAKGGSLSKVKVD
ncbi:MAG: 3-octaprenyl-4-hydroxybenzoate carboxy-lyase [Clostridiales bacterium]|nr:3-octaprenyl-4-hydroxybenzoate carboxy-lyase [Clostridiales bacterium]